MDRGPKELFVFTHSATSVVPTLTNTSDFCLSFDHYDHRDSEILNFVSAAMSVSKLDLIMLYS